MINRVQRLIRAIRATAGAMLLLLNGLAAPVWLASSEPDFCSISVRLNNPVLIRNANVAEKPHPGWEFSFSGLSLPAGRPWLCGPPECVEHERVCHIRPLSIARAMSVFGRCASCGSRTPRQASPRRPQGIRRKYEVKGVGPQATMRPFRVRIALRLEPHRQALVGELQ
jgi:hypothetical protein